MDPVQAAFNTEEEEGLNYNPRTDPHSSVKTRDKREKMSIKSQEHKALSNDHRYAKSRGHSTDPFKRRLYTNVEKAWNKVRSRYGNIEKSRKRKAPFRVKLQAGEEEECFYFYHGKDVLESVCEVIIPCLNGELDVTVQKRVGSKQAWHRSASKPHKFAKVNADEPMFGLEKFIQTYRWPHRKTRLPELLAAKAMA